MLKSRSGSAGHSAPPPPQSIEAVRRRARHRLIGAAILVLVGVLGFPLLFDTRPRPIAVDIPIEIPSRNATPAPMSAKPAPAAAATKAVATVAGSPAVKEEVIVEKPVAQAPVNASSEKAAPVEKALPVEKQEELAAPPAADKPVAKTAINVAEKPADKAADKTTEKTDTKDKASGSERIVVQVGAFAEADRARDVRLKLERAGLKTYTHVADTPQGKRIRVRLGPFATKADAEKAAAKAKSLGLQTTLLWL